MRCDYLGTTWPPRSSLWTSEVETALELREVGVATEDIYSNRLYMATPEGPISPRLVPIHEIGELRYESAEDHVQDGNPAGALEMLVMYEQLANMETLDRHTALVVKTELEAGCGNSAHHLHGRTECLVERILQHE